MFKQDLTLSIFNQIDYYLKEKNKKLIRLMKDQLDGQIIKEFVTLRARRYSYSKYNNNEDKKAKDIKKCIIKIKN